MDGVCPLFDVTIFWTHNILGLATQLQNRGKISTIVHAWRIPPSQTFIFRQSATMKVHANQEVVVNHDYLERTMI